MSQKNTIADWHAVSDAGNAGNNGVSASLHESVFCICSLGDHQVVAMVVLHREEHDYYVVMHCT